MVLYTVSEKKKVRRKKPLFSVNKARYSSLGGIFYLSSLLTATVLRNQTVNNMTIWRDWLLVELIGVAHPVSP